MRKLITPRWLSREVIKDSRDLLRMILQLDLFERNALGHVRGLQVHARGVQSQDVCHRDATNRRAGKL